MPARDQVKTLAHVAACLAVIPSIVSFELRGRLMGRDRALEGSTQAWALVPGLIGQYLRRAFLSRAISHCAKTATIEWGTIFSSASTRIDDDAYVGPCCHLGWVHIERAALLAAGVHIPSGARTHGTSDIDVRIRDQAGSRSCVRIGAGSWIGSAAVIMADVGHDSIIGAGAVVTKAIPDNVLAAGVPARVVRRRDDVTVRATTE